MEKAVAKKADKVVKPATPPIKKVVKEAKTAAKKAKTVAKKTDTGKLKVTLVKSIICTRADHRATVRAMGLRKLNHSVIMSDNPQTRGMVRKVQYLVVCEEVSK